jgi:tetratricopeptide (TPR) repeat protein
LLLALKVGEPVRAARALAMEASYMSATGFDAWPRAERVLDVARATAEKSGDPYAMAIVTGLGGIAAFAATRFQQAIAELKDALARFERLPGSAYEAANATFFLFAAMAYSARYRELRPLLEKALEGAVARGDRYAAVMLRLGVLNSTWLFVGEPERARREIAEARRVLPNDRFRAVHHQAILAESYADVYDGEHERGYARLHAALPAIRRALLLYLSSYRVEIAAVRARLALGCAAGATGRRRDELVREAERLISTLESVPNALGRVNGRMVRASVAMLRGDRDRAIAIVEEMAADGAPDAWLSRTSAKLLLARAKHDEVGALAVEAEFRANGGTVTAGLLRVTFPAFADLLPAEGGTSAARPTKSRDLSAK